MLMSLRGRLPGIAWAVWGLLAALIAIHASLFPLSHSVYPIYAPPARAWWVAEDLYLFRLDYYRYSPLFAIALTPFAVLPDFLGGPLWKLFNLGVFACGLGAAARRLLPLTWDRTQSAAFFLLVLPLSMPCMYNGQANLLMLGCMLLGLARAADGKWNRAAAYLAAATLIKTYPLALALLLAVVCYRQFAGRFAVALGVGLALPFATHWPDVVAWQYRSWWAHLLESPDAPLLRWRWRSFDHFCAVYLQPLSPLTFALLGVLAGGVVLALCLWLARRAPGQRALLTETFVLFCVWVALFGPATEPVTYVVLAVPLAWLLVAAWSGPANWPWRALLLASLLLTGPLVSDLVGERGRVFAREHAFQALGALLFLGGQAVRLAWTYRRPAAAVPVALGSARQAA